MSVPLSPCPAVPQSDDGAQRLAREIAPQVEAAVGLKFKRPVKVQVRSREQLRRFLDRKVRLEFPPAELHAQERAYRAFRLVPDTVDLLALQLDLLQEQVAGFYDPDSAALFVIAGGDPRMLRAIISHELVHALQDQYTNLNGILHARRQNDRQTAGQAVMEGQATVAGMLAMVPGMTYEQLSQGWEAVRAGVREGQSSFARLSSAPLILRESLLFPYVSGAEFILGFESRRGSPAEQPYNERMPVSTEQVLHASRYTAHEAPARLQLARVPGDTVVYEDDFGEFDTRTALMSWGLGEPDAVAAASGWNGDRYQVLGTRGGTALVWAVAWDTPDDAAGFERALRRAWQGATQGRAGSQRWQIDTLEVSGVKVVRLVDAPAAWPGWRALPAVRVTPAAPAAPRRP